MLTTWRGGRRWRGHMPLSLYQIQCDLKGRKVSVISGIMDLFFIFSWCVFLFVTLWCRDCELRKFRVGAAMTLCPPHTSVALNGFLHLLQTILTIMDGGFARHLFKTLIIDFPLGRFLSCRKMPGYGACLNMPCFMSGWFGDKHKKDWMIEILAWFCLFVYVLVLV